MASNLEFVPFKDFVESLPARTVAESGDKAVVSNSTDGPGSETNAVQAQRVLAGNIAQAFDPTRTSANPYKAGESVVYDGIVYTFTVEHYGAWKQGDVMRDYRSEFGNFELSKNILNTEDKELTIFDVTIEESKDGKFIFNGTASSTGGRLTYFTEKLYLEPGTYCFHSKPLNSYSYTNRVWLSAYLQYGTGTTIADAMLTSTVGTSKFTLAEAMEVRLGFNVSRGRVYDNFSFELSLYRGELGKAQGANENSFVDFVARKNYEECNYVFGAYITNNVNQGSLVNIDNPTSDGNYSHYCVSVKKGDNYLLSGKGADAARLWAFIDSDKKLVVNAEKNAVEKDLLLEAPVDGYLVVDSRNNVEYSLRKLLRVGFVSNFIESQKKYFDFLLCRNYNIGYANSQKPLNFLNYTGTTDTTHPKVLYFPAGKFGHKYWMAYTPYPNGNDDYENPCIGYSDDGRLWYGIAANPLDVPADVGTGGYNSDVHLLYNSTTDKFECWWRYVTLIDESRFVGYYRMVSSDGLTWTDKELMHSINNAGKDLSPVVMWDGSKYLIWAVDSGLHKIIYYETPTGKDWVSVRDIQLQYTYDNETFNPWHIDCEFFNSKYHLIVSTKSATTDKWILFRAESSDNETYSTPAALVLDNPGKWDNQLYRSCIVKVSDAEYRLYYSARNGGCNGVGLSIAQEYPLFIGDNKFF